MNRIPCLQYLRDTQEKNHANSRVGMGYVICHNVLCLISNISCLMSFLTYHIYLMHISYISYITHCVLHLITFFMLDFKYLYYSTGVFPTLSRLLLLEDNMSHYVF